MTAPLDLADEIDALIARAADSRKPVTHTIRGEDGWMIAAALRLADCLDRAHRGLVDGRPIRMHGLSGPEGQALLDAYRKARGA